MFKFVGHKVIIFIILTCLEFARHGAHCKLEYKVFLEEVSYVPTDKSKINILRASCKYVPEFAGHKVLKCIILTCLEIARRGAPCKLEYEVFLEEVAYVPTDKSKIQKN